LCGGHFRLEHDWLRWRLQRRTAVEKLVRCGANVQGHALRSEARRACLPQRFESPRRGARRQDMQLQVGI
jgi:hypothetical protein